MNDRENNNPNPGSVTTTTEDDDMGPEGCYLVYEPDSGGRLVVIYSRGPVPLNAVGFWCAGEGKKIHAVFSIK